MTGAAAAEGAAVGGAPLGGGEQLRRARQSLNLPLSEVARRLRLKPEVVVALEGGSFGGLAPAYVRGYLRSYARVVGLDPEEVLNACGGLKAGDAPVVPCSTTREVQGLGDTNRPLRFGTYAVVTVLGLLLAASWRAQYSPPPDGALDADAGGTVQSPSEALLEPEVSAPGGFQYRYPIIHHPEQAPKPAEADPPAAELPEDSVASPSEVASRSSEPVEPPGSADAARPPDGQDPHLVLELGENSWVDVRDAYGAKLYYNLATKGQTITLRGQPPFSVVVGNAPGVAVFYNGRPVTLGPWSRGGVARLTVGDQGPGR